MPASPRALDLEQAYGQRLRELSRRVAAQVGERYRAVGSEELTTRFRRFVPAAAELIAQGQDQAQAAAAGFFRAYVSAETGTAWEPAERDTIRGTTFDGRQLTASLASVPPAVLLGIKQGRPVQFALARGMHLAVLHATTEVADAARRESQHQLAQAPDLFEGWQWVTTSTCAACMARRNNATHPAGKPLNGHPGCQCVIAPALRGIVNKYPRPTGRELFDKLSPKDQAGLFRQLGTEGADEIAQRIRDGRLDLDDIVKVAYPKKWRSLTTTAPRSALPAEAQAATAPVRWPVSRAAQSTVDDWAARIRGIEKHEEGVIVDPASGKLVSHIGKRGKDVGEGVKWTEDEYRSSFDRVFMHNHPTPASPNGTSFSPPDLRLMAERRSVMDVVVTRTHTYTVAPGPRGWPSADAIGTARSRIAAQGKREYQAVNSEANAAIRAASAEQRGEVLARYQGQLDYLGSPHWVMERLAEKFGLTYRRTAVE